MRPLQPVLLQPFAVGILPQFSQFGQSPSRLQVAALSNLRQLGLALCNIIPSGFDCLSGLISLRRLALADCTHVPACLPQLSGLEELSIADETGTLWLDEHSDTADILSDAWPMLAQRLTSLALSAAVIGAFLPAQLLTACSKLQSLFLLPPTLEQQAQHDALVPGPALSSLRRLTATLGTLAKSLPVLQAATRLEFVGAMCFDSQLAGLSQLLDWAVQHPSLHHLALEGWPSEQIHSSSQAIDEARQRSSNLRISLHVSYSPRSLLSTHGFEVF